MPRDVEKGETKRNAEAKNVNETEKKTPDARNANEAKEKKWKAILPESWSVGDRQRGPQDGRG